MPRTALIVGAGIGGLAAGLVLGRAGWRVRILERAATPRELGFALALAPNALAALRELGIADAIARAGARVDVFEIRRGDGALMKRVRFTGERSIVTLRQALHGALLDAVGPEALLPGCEAAAFTDTGDGVELTFDNRAPVRGDILVGADGIGSAIRRHLHPSEPPPSPSGYYALRGVTHDLVFNQGDADAVVYLADGIEAGIARASATAVYWYISAVEEYGAQAATTRDMVERCLPMLDQRFAAVARAAAPDSLRLERLFVRRPLPKWGSGRVTLLGDAAHPVLPHTAQGAALALEDAVALGLALQDGENDPRPGLRCYEAVRARRTRAVVRAGPRIAALTTTRSRARIRVRNAGIRLLPGILLSGTLKLHARDPHRTLRTSTAASARPRRS